MAFRVTHAMTIAIVGAGAGPDNQRGHGDALPVNAEAVVTASCALWRQPWVYIVDAQVDQGRPVLRKKKRRLSFSISFIVSGVRLCLHTGITINIYIAINYKSSKHLHTLKVRTKN
jgi:hypothetical protein